MQIKKLKKILNSLDKKGLRKVSITLFKMTEDLEIENFCLKEKIQKKESEFQEKYTTERMRADGNEIRAESLESLAEKLIDKIPELKGEAEDEENNFKELEINKL